MSEWGETRLGEVCEIIDGDRGTNYPSQNELTSVGFCLFLNTGNVTKTGFDFTNNQFISREKDALLRKGKLQTNDIVMTTRGTVGNVAFYSPKVPFENIRINSGMVLLRVKSELHTRYLYSLLRSYNMQRNIEMYSSGSAQPQLPIKDMRKIKIRVPDLPTQTRIADILSAYDDAIENNNRRIALLEKAARALYNEWFVRFRFPGYESVRIVNGLPEGWEVKPLGDMVNITSSKRIYLSDYVDEGIPFYRSKEVIQSANGEVLTEPLYITVNKYNELKNKFGAPCENDILITSVGTIGVSFLVDKRVFYFKDGNLTWLQSGTNSELALYIFLWLNSDTGKGALLSSTIGTSQSALTIENLKRIKLIKPRDTVLSKFYSSVMPFVEHKRILQQQSQNLARQRDLLLPRLMSGKLEV